MNILAMTGRVASDPETRTTQEGLEVYNFRFCDELTSDFFSCVAFGRVAERMHKLTIAKGTKLTIFGSLKNDEFTDRNGVKRVVTKINVSNFSFGESKNAQGSAPAPARTETATKRPAAETPEDAFMQIPDGLDEALPFV